MPAEPYYSDDLVTLYHGDCLEVPEWLTADVLVTDPPYGQRWKHGAQAKRGHVGDKHPGIAGDEDTATRDAALAMWGTRLAICFGAFAYRPADVRATLAYRKAPDAGSTGSYGGFRRDLEAVYLTGPWPPGFQGRTSLLDTNTRCHGGAHGLVSRYGHPHAKPVDVMETLIGACPPGVIADPFAGAGSTLIAARNLGRRAIGVELEERYCKRAAMRLSQMTLGADAEAPMRDEPVVQVLTELPPAHLLPAKASS